MNDHKKSCASKTAMCTFFHVSVRALRVICQHYAKPVQFKTFFNLSVYPVISQVRSHFTILFFCQVGPSSRETCCCCYKAVLLKAKQRKNMVLSTILTSVQYRFELRYVCTTGKEKKAESSSVLRHAVNLKK